jgi:hypothetical protein
MGMEGCHIEIILDEDFTDDPVVTSHMAAAGVMCAILSNLMSNDYFTLFDLNRQRLLP